ncbi:MAG: toll/interleukin-1 receptor domain-containing protein [Gammaproteobacteria bacterium]|nr:toll/interleukin-1 receptor domain-containing protein [Gammaproteobacteria bacterium]
MATQSELVVRTEELLRRVRRWDWRNTDALARELRVDRDELLHALAHHASGKRPRIRYHPLPSGRRLDILWGLVERVGDDPDLPPLERADLPEDEAPVESDRTIPRVFVSHSHRDAEWVFEIASVLKPLGIACWLYQLHIEFRETIIPSVRSALERCRGAIVCVSRHGLGSLWVQKEFGFALNELNKPLLVVLDGTDPSLLDCFRRDRPAHAMQSQVQQLARETAADLAVEDRERWERISMEFAHGVHDFVQQGGALLVHPEPALENRGEFVRFDQTTDVIRWAAAL